MAPWPWEFWNHWSIQILVLFSLGCQITLFLFAGIRRHGGHPVLRLLLWLAYQLADYTATYALGHLSLKGGPREHPIVAFWAPFLLLHLGGPDNITGYSLEDNDLWKWHMVSAILQVFGAVYILYEYIADRGALLRLASVLMLAIGAVKYWEKAWAVMHSNLDRIRASIKEQPRAMMHVNHGHFHPHDEVFKDGEFDEESLVRRAHSLFYICKRAIVDYPVMRDDSDSHGQDSTRKILEVSLWRLMEIELSLMYDMMYTKAPVIHAWFGYLVRLISPLAIAVSLLLFMFIDKDAHRRVDVDITYILYGCALFMEMVSLLNALGSSWTFAFLSTTRWHWLRYQSLCNKKWDRLRRVVAYLHHPVSVGGGSRYRSRRWSYTMGQYNMLHYCTRSDSAHTRPLLGSLAKMVGRKLNELWNRGHYSWVIEMPEHVKDSISEHMNKMFSNGGRGVNSLGMLKYRWGEESLARENLLKEGSIFKDSLSVEFQECIIIWHIASDVFLAKSKGAKEEEARDNVKAIKVISNHMIFLLVEQPDMMPGRSHNRLCQLTCAHLERIWLSTDRHQNMDLRATLKNLFRIRDPPDSNSRISDREELAKKLYYKYESKGFTYDAPRLPYVAELAKQLLRMEEDGTVNPVKLLLEVWTDILVYAASNCNRKIHAEKLNSGPDLKTIAWLMAEHFYQLYQGSLFKRDQMENDLVGEGTNPQGD
uniref:DUF4220 domain-containing protein n=2 Tax=Aegilops tauschii TaxID=37682 RepID=A0A453L5M8_AEGTS